MSSKYDAKLADQLDPIHADPSSTAADPLAHGVATLEEKLNDPGTVNFHHVLAANADIFAPVHIPSEPLKNLFDRYGVFHLLRGTLQYTVPELIAEAVGAARGEQEPPSISSTRLRHGVEPGTLLRPIARFAGRGRPVTGDDREGQGTPWRSTTVWASATSSRR